MSEKTEARKKVDRLGDTLYTFRLDRDISSNKFAETLADFEQAIREDSAHWCPWISRDDHLPPPHEDFIALNSDGRIFRSRMCYGLHHPWFTYPQGDESPSDTLPDWIDVTHWIPLAELPT